MKPTSSVLLWTSKTAYLPWPQLKALCIFTNTVHRSSDFVFSKLFAAATLMAVSTKSGICPILEAISLLALRTSFGNGKFQAKNVHLTPKRSVKNVQISSFPAVEAKYKCRQSMRPLLILLKGHSTQRVWLKALIPIFCRPLNIWSTVTWYRIASRWITHTQRLLRRAMTAKYRSSPNNWIESLARLKLDIKPGLDNSTIRRTTAARWYLSDMSNSSTYGRWRAQLLLENELKKFQNSLRWFTIPLLLPSF